MAIRPLDPSDLGDLPPDDTVAAGSGVLERRGNSVDWRAPDGRLVFCGVTEDPDVVHASLDALGVADHPPELADWGFSMPEFGEEEPAPNPARPRRAPATPPWSPPPTRRRR